MPLPDMPAAAQHVWEWFQHLADIRDAGFGLGPLTHQEIKAASDLLEWRIIPWEVRLLLGIDRIFRRVKNEKSKKPKDETMTVAALDNVEEVDALFAKWG